MSRPKTDIPAGAAHIPAGHREWQRLLAECDGNQKRLAERLGEKRSTVQGWMKKPESMPVRVLPAILREFPDADMSALSGGAMPEGVARVAEPPGIYATAPDHALLDALAARLTRPTPEIRWIGDRDAVNALEGEAAYQAVPFAADAAAAGTGAVMDDQIGGYVMMHESVMCDALGEVVCVRVAGDSMEPTLTDGSIVAVDRGRRDPHQANGRIVLARAEDGVVLKRWHRRDDHIMLESDNRAHRPIVLCPHMVDEHTLIGVAFWAWVDLR